VSPSEAVMREPGGGSRVADWIPAGGARVLGVTHLPEGAATAGVVVCPALFAERSANRRAEVLLAQRLTEMGIAVLRFDYRGTGNSEGDARQLTLDAARDDCFAAAQRLRERAEVEAIGVLGTRWGALVAACAAAGSGARALALWEPKVDAEEYFQELLQTRAFHLLWHRGRRDYDAVEPRLDASRTIDMPGWRIEPPLLRSSLGRSVAGELGRTPPPTRLVHASGGRRDGERLRDRLTGLGARVDASVLEGRATWWWMPNRLMDPAAAPPALEAAVPDTAAWFVERLAA
jgi:alpha/beta superfamily hydrolase